MALSSESKEKACADQKIASRREAARWARIKRVYGITRDEYNLLDTGSCPVCLRTWGDTVRPAIDHDHATGEIRGLLCLYCNRYRVGRHRDADLVQRIADYLRSPRKFIVPKRKPKRKKNVKKRNSSKRK